ncbi:MAG: hypothetical protein ACE5NM_13530 [Sedimentisphaerales bacterium]
MNRPRMYQPQLLFPGKVAWNRFPKPVQKQCRQLISQMLREVITAEVKSKEDPNNERED